MTAVLQPGDVWAVDAPGIGRPLIILGSLLMHNYAPVDHVVTVHHADKRGVWWGIEGRPSGVGWVQMDRYLTGPAGRRARGNTGQPRTPQQRQAICALAEGLLGTGYDWAGGIAADCAGVFGAAELQAALEHWWGWADDVARPPHVVCSSAAAWIYGRLGLAHPPGKDELVTPADWWQFSRQWQTDR